MSDDREELLRLVLDLRRRIERAAAMGAALPSARRRAARAAAVPHEPEPAADPSPAAAPVVAAAASLPFAADAPRLDPGAREAILRRIAEEIRECRKCRLCEGRTNTVPGEGNPSARLLFIGEGPGANEDAQGRPFVGRAGELLTQIIENGMRIARGDVYIANIVKCRPPENRAPRPDEVAACLPYLRRQIEAIDPEVIVTLGRPATLAVLGRGESITSLRGRVYAWEGRKVIPTFHPAYLLRNPAAKPDAWKDIQIAMRELGLPIPPPARPR